jgi:hypothetical protein
MESNKHVGEMLVNLLREHGTETEVEKLLTHISQVEMMTHLLVVLTFRLARVEKTTKSNKDNENVRIFRRINSAKYLYMYIYLFKILCQRSKFIDQIEEAKRLRQYRKVYGKIVQ